MSLFEQFSGSGSGTGSGDEYNIPYSLRFRSAGSAYLSKSGITTTDTKICTASLWVKRGVINVHSVYFR